MIHHVTRAISPSQQDACIAFYRILGFELVSVPPGIAGRAVWLESIGPEEPRSQVHLMPVSDPGPDRGHVALVCPDYDVTLERLHAAGHEVEPRREHWGSPRAYVRDPAGNLVELIAWPPGERRE